MARFRYKARDARGEAVNGALEASSPDAVATQLLNSGITPIEISETKADSSATPSLSQRLGARKPTLDDVALFARQMYTLLHAGVPIIRALNGLAENTRNTMLAEALREVVLHLEAGRDLTNALAQQPDVFSRLFVSMVQVGESTGQLDEAFLQLSRYLESEKEIRDRIKTALRYPITVLSFIAAALVIINIYVIPQFASMFRSFGADLPLPTRILMATSDFFVAYWPHMLLVLIGLIFGLRSYLATEPGRYRWDKAKLKIPYTGGIIFRATLARYARAFAMALRSGVPLVQSLTVVSMAVDNLFVGDRILSMRTGIERGDSLTRTAAASGLFTPLVMQMLAVGEETGSVDELLLEVAAFYEREVDYDLKRLSAAIEPVMLIIIGVMILVLMLGVFMPLWDMATAARG